MKICLVSAFPPSQGGLSEYGLHLAQELRGNPFLNLTILADQISPSHSELEGFSVQRCWSPDDPASTVHILREVARLKPDVVWFNLLFSTFGRNPLIAFSGLLTPLLTRLSGRYTHVTLHHLMDTVDLKDAGVRHARTYRMAGAVATRILLLSNSVSVLMPGYRKILHEKYGRDNVHLRSHGILTRRPEPPDFSRRKNPEHRILAFGKWGTYKRLELMVEALQPICEALPHARLVIAGGDHPQAPGYVESMKRKYADNPAIEFTGYVEEDRLPDLFQRSSVAVMPYSSSTGCSGVAHLACAYGVPIVCADLPDFRQMAYSEELAIEFYQPGSAPDLAECLVRLLADPEKQQAMATQNFSAALRMTMPNIIQKYLRHFELEQRTEALRYVTKFRRFPSWIPSRGLMARLMTRNALGLIHRSSIPRSLDRPGRKNLLHSDGNGSRYLSGTGVPVNSHGITGRRRDGRGSSMAATSSAARGAYHSDGDHDENPEQPAPAPVSGIAAASESQYPEGQQQGGIDWNRFPLLGQVRPTEPGGVNGNGGNGSSRNGKSRSGGARTGSDGDGRKSATQIMR